MATTRFIPPKIIGILNLTEDSFSDGGLYLEPAKAREHALRLVEDGANVIDLGAASSNPESKTVSPAEEQRRLQPLIALLQERRAKISVDSFQLETQRFALTQGVDFLNDIQGFPKPEIYEEIAAAACKLIVMHSVQRFGKARKIQTDPEEVLGSISRFFEERLAALSSAGIQRKRIILDPGMGFFLGSNPEPSVRVLRNVQQLKREFGQPVLISVSRKSFLCTITKRTADTAGSATLAAELFAALQGVDYIRTHDVLSLKDGLKVFEALNEMPEAQHDG
jgi:dihydropteroate synthase type 2/dihydropteroate synthase type 3